MEKNKIVVQGKFEGSRAKFRKVHKNKESENYFLKLYKKLKKRSEN
jgi:hypothetical protein